MTVRVALVGGPMYDHLYTLLDGLDVEVVVHADHPTLKWGNHAIKPRAGMVNSMCERSPRASSLTHSALRLPTSSITEPTCPVGTSTTPCGRWLRLSQYIRAADAPASDNQ